MSDNTQQELLCSNLRSAHMSGQFLALRVTCLLLVCFSFTSSGWSQPKKSPESSVVTQESLQGNGKVIEFKQLKLEGTVQRPSAAYLMQRRKLKFKGIIPKKSFISKIKQSVSKPPF